MTMIRERVERAQKLTTITAADRPTPYAGINWSREQAIIDQVNLEDTLRTEQTLSFKIMSELPYEKPTALSLWRFMQGILP